MNLIVDIGNTRAKIALFNSDNQIVESFFCDGDLPDIETKISGLNYRRLIISSVRGNYSWKIEDALCFDHTTPIPLKSLYQSKTIGVDRLSAAVGANEITPHKNCLIFDLGSALTIDFVSSKNIYMGGNISPGMSMRFNALHTKTGQLPLLNSNGWDFNLHAQTTQEAIRSGVVQSLIFEIERYIELYEQQYPDLNVFFTGGDAIFFAKQIKKSIFADENLVLKGLNRILNYNA